MTEGTSCGPACDEVTANVKFVMQVKKSFEKPYLESVFLGFKVKFE